MASSEITTTPSPPRVPRITIFGSLNIDLVSYVPHHPAPGETLTASSFAISPGGKGANQAVAAAKLSRPSADRPDKMAGSADEAARVSMVGCVGTVDGYGDLLTSNLLWHGVDVSGVQARAGMKTGTAIIIVEQPTGENRIVLSPGANHALGKEDVKAVLGWDSEANREGGEEGKMDLLIMQLEIPLETVLEALKLAREKDVPVLLNPAPAVPLPDEAFAGLKHLIVNETEAAMLSGFPEAELETEEGLEKVAGSFVAKGVENVVITLGGRGVYFMGGAGKEEEKKKKKKGLVAARKAEVVDTTAAGDTFVGQYALEMVGAGKGEEGEADIERAVRKANRAAAKTVERMGAQDSIPWRDELEEDGEE